MIIYTLLLITRILYLPKTTLINSDMVDKYLNCIDSFTLIYLIDKLEYITLEHPFRLNDLY